MDELSHDELVEIAEKSDIVAKSFLLALLRKGVKGEDLKARFEDCIEDVPYILRAVEKGLPLPKRERDDDAGELDDEPVLDPDLLKWAGEQMALIMIREKFGTGPVPDA